jgi:hypothetical protein
MDSSDGEFTYSKLVEFIFKEFTDLSDSEIDQNKDDAMLVMMSILDKMEKKEEHVLNFQGSMPGGIDVASDMIKVQQDLYDDYFKPNPTFHENSFWYRFRRSTHLFSCIVMV